MKKLAFDENRTYGVEIEVLTRGVTIPMIAQAIRNFGVVAYEEGYNHITKNYWKVITDSSCGYEVVSPILKGYDGLEQIKKVCQALNSINCKVDKRCGLHVHHNASDLSIKHFRNLYIAYAKYEKGIDSLMPISRRGNNNDFCRTLDRYGHSIQFMLDEIKKCKTLEGLSNIYNSRYVKLNVKSYLRHGTIEFRQHSGTTEADKITNWVMFSQMMLNKAISGSVQSIYKQERDNLEGLLWSMNTSRKEAITEELREVVKFYKARAKALAM